MQLGGLLVKEETLAVLEHGSIWTEHGFIGAWPYRSMASSEHGITMEVYVCE